MSKNKVWKQFLAQIANFSCKEFIINNETEHTMSYLVNFDKLPPTAKQPETLTIKTVNDKLDRLTTIVFDFIQEQKKFNEEQKKFNEDQKNFNGLVLERFEEQKKFNALVIERFEEQKKFNEDQKKFNEEQKKFNVLVLKRLDEHADIFKRNNLK